METTMSAVKLVQKEDVPNLKFPSEDVLESQDQIKLRIAALNRAIILGNTQKRKVKIYFDDQEGPKMVETTIWAVTEKNIVLKKGVAIPIRRVREISAY